MPIRPLPDDLVRRPVTRRLASQYGISDREMSGPLWRSRFRGVRSWAAADPEAARTRICEAAALLPEGGVVTGWAAGYLHGAFDLDGLAPDGSSFLPVPVCLPPPVQIRRRAGITAIRSSLTVDDVLVVDDMPAASPVRAAFDLARTGSLVEAVTGLDAMLRSDVVELQDVAGYVEERRRWRGRPRARRAAELADRRARSCQESRLRMLWILDAMLPTPEVNVAVFDARGRLLGLPDLLDPLSGLVAEYDGAGHREPDRHTADNVREESLEQHGLVVVRATGLDLTRFRARTVDRLRSGYRRALDQKPNRMTWSLDPGWP